MEMGTSKESTAVRMLCWIWREGCAPACPRTAAPRAAAPTAPGAPAARWARARAAAPLPRRTSARAHGPSRTASRTPPRSAPTPGTPPPPSPPARRGRPRPSPMPLGSPLPAAARSWQCEIDSRRPVLILYPARVASGARSLPWGEAVVSVRSRDSLRPATNQSINQQPRTKNPNAKAGTPPPDGRAESDGSSTPGGGRRRELWPGRKSVRHWLDGEGGVEGVVGGLEEEEEEEVVVGRWERHARPPATTTCSSNSSSSSARTAQARSPTKVAGSFVRGDGW